MLITVCVCLYALYFLFIKHVHFKTDLFNFKGGYKHDLPLPLGNVDGFPPELPIAQAFENLRQVVYNRSLIIKNAGNLVNINYELIV